MATRSVCCPSLTQTLLYLLLVLLPQMIWLLHSNSGLAAVCESCSPSIHSTRSENNGHHKLNSSSIEEEYATLCSCGLDHDDKRYEEFSRLDGGWSTPDQYASLAGPCTVQRVNGSGFTQTDFESKFAYTQPVVITDLQEQLGFKDASTKYRLLRDYGHDIITVATANTHSYHKEQVTLCEYVETMMSPQTLNNRGNETLYYFGDNNRESWESLFSLYLLPPYRVPDSTHVLSFGLAGPGTGVPFHIHGPTFAETMYGRKRWFLYPPSHRPQFDPDQTTLHWYTYTYPQLTPSEKPLECTLHPGEVIYFPNKWWHATLNVDTAVFMSTFYS